MTFKDKVKGQGLKINQGVLEAKNQNVAAPDDRNLMILSSITLNKSLKKVPGDYAHNYQVHESFGQTG